MARLEGNQETEGVLSVQVTSLEEGSVVVRGVAAFQSSAPSDADFQQVLSSSDTLTDGNTVLSISTQSVIAGGKAQRCGRVLMSVK